MQGLINTSILIAAVCGLAFASTLVFFKMEFFKSYNRYAMSTCQEISLFLAALISLLSSFAVQSDILDYTFITFFVGKNIIFTFTMVVEMVIEL